MNAAYLMANDWKWNNSRSVQKWTVISNRGTQLTWIELVSSTDDGKPIEFAILPVDSNSLYSLWWKAQPKLVDYGRSATRNIFQVQF